MTMNGPRNGLRIFDVTIHDYLKVVRLDAA